MRAVNPPGQDWQRTFRSVATFGHDGRRRSAFASRLSPNIMGLGPGPASACDLESSDSSGATESCSLGDEKKTEFETPGLERDRVSLRGSHSRPLVSTTATVQSIRTP